ncbi:MAG TPA: hypothetical protein VMF29_02085 [Candidatus Edwardsbacteria bacterium]|nr:hypothetical protein [Candidatus Edwardsbacteria bacterium]
MAGNNKASAGGLIAVLIVIAVVTIGGVAGYSYVSWPQLDPTVMGTMRSNQLEILAKSAARLSVSPLFDLTDPLDRQMALQKMIKDLQADFPEVNEVIVLDDKNTVAYSPRDAEVGQPYKAPLEVKLGVGNKFAKQELASGKTWIAAPVTVGKDRKVIGGVRMTVSMPAATGSAGGNKNIVLIAGLVALLIGVIVPAVMVSAKVKGAAVAAPAGGDKTNALKGEEAAIAARLKDARSEIAKAEEVKAQTAALENQMEFLRKQQFEETYKLEGIKKEAAEVAAHLEQRRQMLAATPEERVANLTKEERDLVANIAAHKKEEQQLALKIQEIRKKMIELDRRVEGRRKD